MLVGLLALLFGEWSPHGTPPRRCKGTVDSVKLCMMSRPMTLGETFNYTAIGLYRVLQ